MQLVGLAYEKILSGHGHEEAVHVVYLKPNDQAAVWKTKCQQLEDQNQDLHRRNELLEKKLKAALEKQNAQQQEKVPTDAEAKQKQIQDEDMQALRRENRRLQSQIDVLRREKKSTKTAVVKSEIPGQLVAASQRLTPVVAGQIKAIGRSRYWGRLAMLAIPIVLVWVAIGPGKEPLMSAWDSLNPEPQRVSKPTMRLLHHDTTQTQSSNTEHVVSPEGVALDREVIVPRIKLSGDVGIWQVSKFENTPNYYISVRSEKGSYVIKSCDGDFQYYKNTLLRSGRMAANLIYSRDERHFEIYDIPYGNGSFAHNWAKSKSLLINNEYFPNKNFSNSFSALQQYCQ
ncbi:hypothetical protein PTW35_08015 [Photobacterium sp. DA100]|uniref:hypothetical protein n=1 Tax=Photobacterium sp. DA100 TaxID=3027472 RepID=UPI0024787D13|nr:hypothetical protein [Photobacterium sp. DA100]WEM43714.1 hypothetical protein PTW35_08015 [Photobacterium sp. DA100]